MKAYCPQIKGLYLDDIKTFAQEHPRTLMYLPNFEELNKCGREWTTSICYTLYPDDFKQWVDERLKIQRKAFDESRKLEVS